MMRSSATVCARCWLEHVAPGRVLLELGLPLCRNVSVHFWFELEADLPLAAASTVQENSARWSRRWFGTP